MQRVLLHLGETYAARSKARLFETLRPVLLAGGSLRGEDNARLAAEAGMSEGALRVALTRMLQDYRSALKEEVLQTVESGDAVEAEIAHLLQVFRR